ncbi:hypothetical protein PCANC_04943 [Puccinia coronata f. sp. avenae]|uniref:Uncharacterized protein n=1 Tax=Puccinia coronata f. sp. avenae TaxID=200324 RepID=A0A2N5TGF5_9BASI|nr:hypothetical protein PCASD_07459 [Puccinia coronata f. sp. avenae]PLW54384.1 hypothetical protein PCANC_04943 [Puccinia coronata f. sp. avenae]
MPMKCKLVPARQGVAPRQAGTGLHGAAARQGVIPRLEQVPACTCSPRESSSAVWWYKLVPARRGVIPCRAGTSLYQPGEELFLAKQQLAEELFLGEQVPVCTFLLIGQEQLLGEPVQAARRGQRQQPPVKPRAGVVLPGFLTNALAKL